MTEIITHFHFIRPFWLLLAVPALVIGGILLKQKLSSGQWQKHIDPELQGYMLDNSLGKKTYSGTSLLVFSWLIFTLALAGPSWERKPVPVVTNPDALVILLDMSLSMAAQDVAPTRATRAIHKATDILRGRVDGQTAVIAYSGDAHTVVPFTDDQVTIEHLLSSLSPEIMPKLGSRPDKAIELAAKLMQDAGLSKASMLLITDGIRDLDISRIEKAMRPEMTLGIIAIGTPEGAPISLGDQGFLKDDKGTIILPKLDTRPIQSLANATGGRWKKLSYDDSDWKAVLNSPDFGDALKQNGQVQKEQQQDDSETVEQWQDAGFWLIILLLPMALLNFRRGGLMNLCLGLLIAGLYFQPAPASASIWNDLWQTKNQQGQKQLETDPAAAAETFKNSEWRGTANYRAGNYEEAAEEFAKSDTAHSDYNRGNALAQAGKLQEALEAYDSALDKETNFPQAEKNRAIIEEMLKQQQDQQQNQDQNQQNSDDQSGDNSDQKGDQSQQNQQQNQDQQQNDSGNQNSDQQNQSDSNSASNNSSDQQDSGQNSQKQQQNQQQEQQDQEYADQQSQRQNQSENTPGDEEQTSQAREGMNENQDLESQQEQRAQQNAQSDQEPGQEQEPQASPEALNNFSNMNREQQAAVESLLNQVPDNPGLLMQRKFLYQYRQKEDNTEEDVLW